MDEPALTLAARHLPVTRPPRPRDPFASPQEEHAMPQHLYVAELLGVLPEPLPLELAEVVAETLAIGVDEIGTGQLPDEGGSSRWGVFRVHLVVHSPARAATAALWLARELGDPQRACILRAWSEASPDQAGGAA
jgi:hypothetical protein